MGHNRYFTAIMAIAAWTHGVFTNYFYYSDFLNGNALVFCAISLEMFAETYCASIPYELRKPKWFNKSMLQ